MRRSRRGPVCRPGPAPRRGRATYLSAPARPGRSARTPGRRDSPAWEVARCVRAASSGAITAPGARRTSSDRVGSIPPSAAASMSEGVLTQSAHAANDARRSTPSARIASRSRKPTRRQATPSSASSARVETTRSFEKGYAHTEGHHEHPESMPRGRVGDGVHVRAPATRDQRRCHLI